MMQSGRPNPLPPSGRIDALFNEHHRIAQLCLAVSLFEHISGVAGGAVFISSCTSSWRPVLGEAQRPAELYSHSAWASVPSGVVAAFVRIAFTKSGRRRAVEPAVALMREKCVPLMSGLRFLEKPEYPQDYLRHIAARASKAGSESRVGPTVCPRARLLLLQRQSRCRGFFAWLFAPNASPPVRRVVNSGSGAAQFFDGGSHIAHFAHLLFLLPRIDSDRQVS